MKNLISFLSLLLVVANVFAQTPTPVQPEPVKSIQDAMIYNSLPKGDGTPVGNANSMHTYDLRYEGMKGTQYFIDEWLLGQLIFSNGNNKTPKSIPLKYDTFTKDLIFKRPQGDSIIVNPKQISGFVINDPSHNISYPFVKHENLKTETGIIPLCYLMVLYKNKTSLLKYISKRVQKADYQGAYSVDRRYDSYLDYSEYFVQKPDSSLTRVKLKKSSIVDILEDKKPQIEAFIKKENLTFKNDIDVARVLSYYDSL